MDIDFFAPFRSVTATRTPAHPDYLSDDFLDRVRRAYRLVPAEAPTDGAIWTAIGALRADVHAALTAQDNAKLREIFREPATTDLFYGTDNLAKSVLDSIRPSLGPVKTATVQQVTQTIYKLSEALGIRRWLPANGEQASNYYPAGHEVQPEVDSLLPLLDDYLGFDITFPTPFSGELGLETGRGTVSYRVLQALYQAHRIAQELPDKGSSILEIGPGMGRTAFYAHAMGFRDYTTIDLPIGVVGQACFLGAVLGPENIWMIGDHDFQAAGKCKLLPSTLPLLPNSEYDLVLNVDSLTEMSLDVSSMYGRWIAEVCDVFLSVNHEANGPRIADIARAHFKGAQTRRAPYWMRDGYVEEIFMFDRSRSTGRSLPGAPS